jgi:hypothetical protein
MSIVDRCNRQLITPASSTGFLPAFGLDPPLMALVAPFCLIFSLIAYLPLRDVVLSFLALLPVEQ